MSRARDVIADLPELPLEPFELAGTLAHAKRGPFVTIVPHPRPAPTHPVRTIPALPIPPKSSHYTRDYFVQVTYPLVFCTSPGELLEGLELHTAMGAPAPGASPAASPHDVHAIGLDERHYKLSALNGRRFTHPLFCTVRGGPWTAWVIEKESCTLGEANRWELGVYGIPGVGMLWYGEWLDQPAVPNLTVIKNGLQMRHATTQCCAGFKWCPTTQSCVPNQVDCQSPVPI